MKTNPTIQQAVDAIRVIDTHEHLYEERERLNKPIDFIDLFDQYACYDLQSAGMPAADWERCLQPDTPADEKWKLFEPYYRAARNTAYLKASEIAIRDLYGIHQLDSKNCHQVTERMGQRNQPGVSKWVLQEKSGIELAQVTSLNDPFFRMDTDWSIFQQDLCVQYLMAWPLPLEELQQDTGVTINCFKDYARAIDTLFEHFGPHAVAIKQQSTYWRVQKFDQVSDSTAESAFDRAMVRPLRATESDRKLLQDWGLHRSLRLACKYQLPIKMHTGYRNGINTMDLNHCRARDLVNLFFDYPQGRFDLFHMGYPYQEEVLALAKQFSNVYVDLCWAWIMDPQASGRFLKQFLTAVPANKLFGFGGDYWMAEPVYGHLKLARAGISRALSEMVEEEYFSVDQALSIARMILRDNALAVFGIKPHP
ncbi:MAG: amidohydrolase family protein [Planctomycetota bacterium]|jgi:hypothetical protein